MNKRKTLGNLYMIPCLLGNENISLLPEATLERIKNIQYFVVERAKTARQFLKVAGTPYPMSEIMIIELDKHGDNDWSEFLKPIFEGHDVGFLSEAGCPGVADPGAMLAAAAHRKDVMIFPLVGPTSIILAIMGSGLNGQQFTFLGYQPVKVDELGRALKKAEDISRKTNTTQVAIETPYRNNRFLETAIKNLNSNTYFTVASELSLPSQYIKTLKIKDWKAMKELPDLHKKPTVFCWLA